MRCGALSALEGEQHESAGKGGAGPHPWPPPPRAEAGPSPNFHVNFPRRWADATLSEENCDADHAKHLASRPWLSVPYHRCEREQALEHFHISSIPRLMILSPAGKILADNTTPADVTAGFDGWLAAVKSGSG